MKNRSVAGDLFRADGQTEKRDEATSYFPQFSEHTQTSNDSLCPPGPSILHALPSTATTQYIAFFLCINFSAPPFCSLSL